MHRRPIGLCEMNSYTMYHFDIRFDKTVSGPFETRQSQRYIFKSSKGSTRYFKDRISLCLNPLLLQ
jgi:hypothetical protein